MPLLVAIAITIAVVAFRAPAQGFPQGPLDQAKARIKQSNARIPDDVLNEDIKVIQTIYPDVAQKYKDKISTRDLQNSLLRHWITKRTGTTPVKPNRALDADAFKRQMLDQGILNVNSNPVNAEVFVDGMDTGSKTPASFLINPNTPPNTYQVKALKDSLSDSQNAIVNSGQTTSVNLTLK
jgi:hypothetical protein